MHGVGNRSTHFSSCSAAYQKGNKRWFWWKVCASKAHAQPAHCSHGRHQRARIQTTNSQRTSISCYFPLLFIYFLSWRGGRVTSIKRSTLTELCVAGSQTKVWKKSWPHIEVLCFFFLQRGCQQVKQHQKINKYINNQFFQWHLPTQFAKSCYIGWNVNKNRSFFLPCRLWAQINLQGDTIRAQAWAPWKMHR